MHQAHASSPEGLSRTNGAADFNLASAQFSHRALSYPGRPPRLPPRTALQGRCRRAWLPGGAGDIPPLSRPKRQMRLVMPEESIHHPRPGTGGWRSTGAKSRGQASGPAGGAERFRDARPSSPLGPSAGVRAAVARPELPVPCPARPRSRSLPRPPAPGGREGAHLGCMGPGASPGGGEAGAAAASGPSAPARRRPSGRRLPPAPAPATARPQPPPPPPPHGRGPGRRGPGRGRGSAAVEEEEEEEEAGSSR